ncbi:MAG: VCBS repeat-containing protein [Candidatus Latescibacteria bacterium]|nr:VCBS repeat-containing protein [Candidatus Latescibacterota bacterium]
MSWTSLFLLFFLPSHSHAQFRFAPPVVLPTRDQPFYLVTGDFNRDGHLDIGVCNRGSSDVSVFIGNGKGGFPSRLDFPLGDDRRPTSLTAADLNRDGALDLIVTNYRTNTVSILYGNGQGEFASPVEYQAGATPSAVVAADFDGDGRLDLAVANRAGHTPVPGDVSILLQTPAGHFTERETRLLGRSPRALLAADLTGDGKTDLVAANFLAATIFVFTGKGDGSFNDPITLTTRPGPVHLAAADLNEDGQLDLVVANRRAGTGQPGLSVYLGQTEGTFRDPLYLAAGEMAAAVAATDLDGDGHADIALVHGFSDDLMLYRGNGRGEFADPMTIPFEFGISLRSLVAADLDHDGDQDLVIANKDNDTLTVLLNDVAKPVGIAVTGLGATILDDGTVEIAWETATSGVAIFVYRQSGSVQSGGARLDGSSRRTSAPITGLGRHRFVDTDVQPGRVYTYWLEATGHDGSRQVFGPLVVTVVPPDRFDLAQNVPNPFNAGTEIAYRLARTGRVTLTVYNLLGEEVAVLVDGEQPRGYYAVRWDGRNGRGEPAGSGIYLYTLRAGGFTATRRMLLTK